MGGSFEGSTLRQYQCNTWCLNWKSLNGDLVVQLNAKLLQEKPR